MAAHYLEPGYGPANPHPALRVAADALWDALGTQGASDLIEALLARMDALDGDLDAEDDGISEEDDDPAGGACDDEGVAPDDDAGGLIMGGGSGEI